MGLYYIPQKMEIRWVESQWYSITMVLEVIIVILPIWSPFFPPALRYAPTRLASEAKSAAAVVCQYLWQELRKADLKEPKDVVLGRGFFGWIFLGWNLQGICFFEDFGWGNNNWSLFFWVGIGGILLDWQFLSRKSPDWSCRRPDYSPNADCLQSEQGINPTMIRGWSGMYPTLW